MVSMWLNFLDFFSLILGSESQVLGPSENEDNPLLEIDSNTSTLFLAVLAVIMIFISGFIPWYKLLNVLEFNSTRKRMSVIVEDANGVKTLMCKGADSIIKERLSQDSLNSVVYKETQSAVDECARIGLRTLFLAEKILDD